MRGLNGRVAIVTGGARGLGKAAAERLAEEGVKVGILDVREDEAQEVAQAVGGAAFKCDTTDEAQLAAAVEGVHAQLGGPDILVNNAGLIAPRKEWTSWTKQEVARFAEVNYIGYFLAIKAAHPYLKAERARAHHQRRISHVLHGQPRPDALRLSEGRRHRPQLEHGQGARGRQHHRQRRHAPARSLHPAPSSTTTKLCSSERCRTRPSRPASTRST